MTEEQRLHLLTEATLIRFNDLLTPRFITLNNLNGYE